MLRRGKSAGTSRIKTESEMGKYKVTVRPLRDQDSSGDCHFPETDAGMYSAHLRALVDDIKNILGVADACLSGNDVLIESDLEMSALKQSMKGLFAREICYVRYLGIEQIERSQLIEGKGD